MQEPLIDGQMALDISAMADAPFEAQCLAGAVTDANRDDDTAATVLELRRALRRERLAREVCAELNNFTQIHETLTFIVLRIQELTSAESVSIRLENDGEYPCVVQTDHRGIMEDDGRGADVCGAGERRLLIDCLCDVVVSGRCDGAVEHFTEGGSCWCRSATALLNSTSGARLLSGGARYCPRSEYESLALIPLSARGIRIGLIQLQDRRIAMFDEELIGFLESLGQQIGLAIQNARRHSDLYESMKRLRVLHGVIPICAGCKRIRDAGQWKPLEEFITQNSQADFTHGLCPECAEHLYPEVFEHEAVEFN